MVAPAVISVAMKALRAIARYQSTGRLTRYGNDIIRAAARLQTGVKPTAASGRRLALRLAQQLTPGSSEQTLEQLLRPAQLDTADTLELQREAWRLIEQRWRDLYRRDIAQSRDDWRDFHFAVKNGDQQALLGIVQRLSGSSVINEARPDFHAFQRLFK